MTGIAHRICGDLRRWKVELPNGISLRLHHWAAGDPPQYQHAHPWPFLTIVIWGGYDDIADGRPVDCVRAPAVRLRDTNWRHSVVDPLPHTWSIVITGRKLKTWRFWMSGRQVDSEEWNTRAC